MSSGTRSSSLGRRSQRNRKPIDNYFAKTTSSTGSSVGGGGGSSKSSSIISSPRIKAKTKEKLSQKQEQRKNVRRRSVSPSERAPKRLKSSGTDGEKENDDDDVDHQEENNDDDVIVKNDGDSGNNKNINSDDDHDQDDDEEEEVMSSSSSSESDEEDDYVDGKNVPQSNVKKSPGSATRKKVVQIKEPTENDSDDGDDRNNDNDTTKTRLVATKYSRNRTNQSSATSATMTKQIQTAIMAVAKKVLEPVEQSNHDSSLTALLLYSSLSSTGGKRGNNQKRNMSQSGKDISTIARDVVDAIKNNPNHAQIDLLNLIFRSVGCRYEHLMKHEVDLDELSDDDLTGIIEQLVDDMSDTAADCVLLCADPNGSFGRAGGIIRPKVAIKAYRRIYQDFWYELGVSILSEGGSSINNNIDDHSKGSDTGDGGGVEAQSKSSTGVDIARDLISRLMEFVRVGVPDIRAAVAMAIYKLAEALLKNTVQWKIKLDVATRQYQSAKRVSERSLKSKALEEQVNQLTTSIDGVEEIMKDSVMNVFLKRYRDKNEYIRSESLYALSNFALIRPDLFLNGMYLKYFGWLLSDKNEHVRLAAVHGLLAPFRENQLKQDSVTMSRTKNTTIDGEPYDIACMSSVINKFLARLADMVLDVDVSVQEATMELLLHLVRNDFFSDVENDNIWNQINLRAIAADTSATVRRDALYFVIEQLQQFDNGSSTSDADAVERIKALVEWISHILSDSEIPIENIRYGLTDYLVASIRSMPEHKPLASNWSAILQCLQVDGISLTPSRRNARKSISQGDQRQDSVQQRVLLRFLLASADLEVHSISESDTNNTMTQDIDRDLLDIERGLHSDNNILTSKKKVQHTSTSQEELTLALLRALPDLLISFKSESPVLQNLTSLSRYLLPSVFNLSSRKKEFHALSSTLSKLFLEATDDTVLNNCALAMISLSRGEHSRKDEALLILKETATSLKSRLYELLEERTRLASNIDAAMTDNDVLEIDNNGELLENANALSFCVRRLRIISKRWYLPDLMMDGSESDQDDSVDELFTKVVEHFSVELTQRQLPVVEDNDTDLLIPKIWVSLDEQVHAIVATTISDALDLLLCLVSWKLRYYIESKSSKVDDIEFEDDDDGRLLLKMRNQIIQLIVHCYEQFIESEYADQVPICQLGFSTLVQEHAVRLTGDLRMLFPKGWNLVKSKVLSTLALQQETALVGGLVRFVRSQEEKLRVGIDGSESIDSVRKLLLPIARGLAGNWLNGHRKEAGAALTHIYGSGREAQNLVQSLSRVCKKVHPVRLLEAHMVCLRQDFADWKASQPDELETDRPSEEELAEYAKAEKSSKAKFESCENRAVRLSASLGVGTIKNKALAPALSGFIREGVRFAFSAGIEGTEESLYAGDRLFFLLPLSKYLNWIRPIKGARNDLKQFLDTQERELRSDPDYSQLYDEEKGAIETFRKVGDLGSVIGYDANIDEDTARHSENSCSPPSLANITNLSSIPEAALNGATTKGNANSGSIASTSIRSKFSSSQSLSPLEEGDDEGNDELSQLSTSPRRSIGVNDDSITNGLMDEKHSVSTVSPG